MCFKQIYNFYGSTNAPLDRVDNIEKAQIISKVDKKISSLSLFRGETLFTISVLIIEMLIWLVVLKHLIGNIHLLRTFWLFTILYAFILLMLQIIGQIRFVGDTIVIFEDKIIELTWLSSRETLWSHVDRINIYPKYLAEDVRDEAQKHFKKQFAQNIWINIVIEAANKKIYINTAYSHNEDIQNYIREKHADKIAQHGFGKTINQKGILMLAGFVLGPLIIGLVYFLNYCIGLIAK